MDYVINEVDNVTREELMSGDYVMMCCKPITEHSVQQKITLSQ